MSPPIYVGGSSQGVGKTFVALGLLYLLRQHYKTAAWKPIDVGQLKYHAADILTDGQRLHHAAQMADHPNLVNPFLLNEELPPVLAARRDGVTLHPATLHQYFKMLSTRYERVVIEGGRGLFMPLTETEREIDLLANWKPEVLWVTQIGERDLADTLLQIHALKQAQIAITGIILSNGNNIKNAELIHYQWLTLEEELSVTVIALLPFLKSGLEDPAAIGALLTKNFDKNHLGLFRRIE